MTTQLDLFGKSFGGKQADLFVKAIASAPPNHGTDAMPIQPQAGAVPVSLPDPVSTHTQVAVQTGSSILGHPSASRVLCRECGDPLPPKAKACPNCYTYV